MFERAIQVSYTESCLLARRLGDLEDGRNGSDARQALDDAWSQVRDPSDCNHIIGTMSCYIIVYLSYITKHKND